MTYPSGVQPNLNLAIIKGIALPLPQPSEVVAINEIVSTRLSQVGAYAKDIPTWAQQSDSLRQKILSHAFRGRLVAHQATDEPASILLERIAAERGQVNAAPKRPRSKTQAA